MTADSKATQTTEAEALLELMHLGAAEQDPSRIVALICEYAARLAKADYAGVRLTEADGRVEWRGMWGNRSDAWRHPRSSSLRGTASEALTTGRTTITRQDPLANAARLHAHSVRVTEAVMVELAAPLTYSGNTLGALVLGWRSEISPSVQQVRLAEVLAGYGAAVLAGARSREESNRRRAEAEALAELARQGAAAHEIEPVVDLVCQTACQLIGAEFAALMVRAPGGVAWLGVWGNRSDIWKERHNPSGRGPAAKSMAEGRTVVFQADPDREADGLLANLAVLRSEGAETALAVPLQRRDGPLGSLVAGWRTPQEVSADQRRLAEALGGYATAVLDNALSHLESERRRIEAEALAELVRLGAAEHDPEQAVSFICERGCSLLGADYAGFSTIEEDGQRVWRGTSGMNQTEQPRRWFSRGRGIGATTMALAAGHAIVIEGIHKQADPSLFHSLGGGQTGLVAPCLGRDGLKGALHLGWRRELAISPAQLRLAEALAGYAAVILENARAHAALQERAETVRLANEQLTRVDEMKSNLISNVSHELRTPLSSIRAFSELLLDANVEAETRMEFAHIINRESERLTRLVSNLLDLSRIQSRGVAWRVQALDARKQLELAVAAMRPAADDKRLEMSLRVAPEVTGICADPDGLQQALVNLIANAIKFTQEGEVVVSAACVEGGVLVSVNDTGMGMAKEEQARVFDRFYQAGNILTSKPAGTGLGLAITKEILVQHGTDISLESTLGKGSTFSFVLPEPV
ncbi:MAG: GAF domain-containing protein [Chloroflexota bacterium]